MIVLREGANLNSVKRTCPACGKLMRIRKATKGKYAGSYFWGCSGDPACNKIVRLTQTEIEIINSESVPFQKENAQKNETQAETPILTKQFKAKSCIEGYEAEDLSVHWHIIYRFTIYKEKTISNGERV
ncbi:MAG TPA: hypothetical protein GX708_03995 [Gallicola sp.]|nr:hypothetical protein [Gallicola sp.]